MNTYAKLLKGARLLKETEVPQVGDWCRWSGNPRDEWLPVNPRFLNLPVATNRVRVGQPTLQFCTFSK